MALIKKVNGILPQWGENCFIAENSTLTGDIIMGNNCSVWFNAVIRGDVHSIRIGDNVNIQDGAILHCTYKVAPLKIGSFVSIAHGAIVHGCTIHDNVLIGMGAIIMDHAVIESNCIIAAGAIVSKNTLVTSGTVWGGVPAKKIKDILKNLDLKALGYIECYEAISRYFHKKEEMPLTGVLVELDKQDVSVFILKGGSVVFKKNVARTDNVAEDISGALISLKNNFLIPSRMIIYNSIDLDATAEKIISYNFDKKMFLQLPRVAICHEDEVVEGLVDVFSSQINSVSSSGKHENQDNDFGFVVNQDVEEFNGFSNEDKVPVNMPNPFSLKIPRINFSLPKIKIPFLLGKAAVVFGIMTILLSIFLNEYFFHKAELKIYLKNADIKKTAVFDLDFKLATASSSYSKTAATTGSRQVGEPAKGQVTIHNFDDTEKTFQKNTELEGSGIKYATDTEIKVASSSLAIDGSAKLPGKKSVSVTAKTIGPEGNLAKGQRFSLVGYPITTYFAINDSSFSGGTKKTVRTVSSNDRDNLEKAIFNEVKKNQSLPKNLRNSSFFSGLTKTILTESSFSKEVGEEGESLSLKTKAKTVYYLYEKNGLISLIKQNIEKENKEGYVIDDDTISHTIKSAKLSENNKVKAEISIKAKSIKKVDEEKLVGEVLAKNKMKLEFLKNDFEILGYEIKVVNPFSPFENFTPIFKKNVNLITSYL